MSDAEAIKPSSRQLLNITKGLLDNCEAECASLRAQIAHLASIPEGHPYHEVWKEVLQLRASNKELLEAFERLLEWSNDEGTIAVARAAITKAKGEA